jgi:nicotinate-nucleotide--dimethylbenzimidazole phosphoribosyltransferase
VTHQETLANMIDSIREPDLDFITQAWGRLDQLTKPPNSLGKLEEIAARVAVVQHDIKPSVDRKAIILAAADHGVVAEGVSPFPQEVTWQMVANFVSGGAAINHLAASVGADLHIVDVGVVDDTSSLEGVRQEKIRPGTANMTQGPAMERDEAARAILVGVEMVREAVAEGVNLIGTGEMGIGNTTASSAMTSVLCRVFPAAVVGRGTGVDDAGMQRKALAIGQALEANDINPDDALGTLAAVGGFEIAALAGVVLGAAEQGICVVTDGFISTVATLTAVRLCPAAIHYVLPSHLSVEPGHVIVLDELGLAPVLDLDMRLGEGTGCALAMGIIDAACRMMSGMATFKEAGVSDEGDA